MQTSLSAPTLEVYYRYLPLYKLDREDAGRRPGRAGREAGRRSSRQAAKEKDK